MEQIKTKKDLITALSEGKPLQPIVIYDLIRHRIVSKKEFEHLFELYFRGNEKDAVLKTYMHFWHIMEKKVGHESNEDSKLGE